MTSLGIALPPLTPGLLFAQIIVMLGFGGLLAAWVGGASPRQVASLGQGRRLVVVDRERATASDLGVPFRAWVGIRLAVVVLAVLIGLVSGTVVLLVALLVAAVLGVPWAFAGRAMKRRIERDRSMMGWLTDLSESMQVTGQGLDTSIRDAALRPAPAHLEYVLEPLGEPGSLIDHLATVATRSRSGTIQQALGAVIFSRARDVDVLIRQVDSVIVPVGRQRITVEEEALGTLTQQRAVAMVMVGLYVGVIAMMLGTPSLASFYRGVTGQLVLGGVLCFYTFVVWLMGVIVRTPKWAEWNMDEVVRLEAELRAS